MKEFLHDVGNVYTIAFILFWVFIYVYVRKPALQWLDGEIGKISAELNTARELRAEAEGALAECKMKQVETEKEAQMLLKMAREQAEAMRKQADADMSAFLSRQQHLASERIRMAQERAVAAVREEAVRLGMELARKKLAENLSESDILGLFEGAIDNLPEFKCVKKAS